MFEIVDSHCHLDFKDFENDLDEIILRAEEKNVNHFLTISVNLENFPKILKLTNKYKNVWCTTGIHPNNVGLETKKCDDLFDTLKKNLQLNDKVVGLGETGLDFYRSREFEEKQIDYFEVHLNLSGEKKIPTVIHTRNAEVETKEILRSKVKIYNSIGLIHCFTGSQELARIALDNGFYLSISGVITFNNSHDLKKIVKYIPNDRILVETDAPYLAPKPFRGKRNEPSLIAHTLKEIAEIKKKKTSEMAMITTKNFFNLFGKVKN